MFLLFFLLALQPDFGMSVTFTIITISQLFIAGLPIILIIFGLGIAISGGTMAYLTFDHVAKRIDNFLIADISQNYQVQKSLEAYANGGLFGKGPGGGTVKKFIPDCHTDFIFSVAGEELGGILSIIIIVLFGFLITRLLLKIMKSDDMFKIYTSCAIITQIGVQSIFNIGVTLHIFPTKGMTLPLISYGGSSMISSAIAFGILLNFTRRQYGVKQFYMNKGNK